MAREKLILICQSGGDFVTKDDGTLSYTGGEAYATTINHGTLFDDLKLEVAETCDLDQKTVSIKYFLPGNKRNLITVKNDKDVKRMIDFHGDSITADVFITGSAGFDRSALNMNASRSKNTKQEETVKRGSVTTTTASPSPAKRTHLVTAKAATETVVRVTRRTAAKAAATAAAVAERVVRTTRRTSAKAASDANSEGPTETVVSSDDNLEGSTKETTSSTPSSEKADDPVNSDSESDYVPSRSGRKPNSQIDVNASPADTVKKRRRTASWRFGANGPTIVSARDDDSREMKSRKMTISDSYGARKSARKSSRIASFGDDSRERKTRKSSRSQRSPSLADGSDHSLDMAIGEVDDFDNPAPIAIWDDDVTPESLVATWRKAITGVGQEFKNVQEFRDALQKYAIANRFGYKLKKNDTVRAIGGCRAEGCSWKIHAVWVPASESFKIKTLHNVHTCDKESRKSAHPKKNWLVSTIKERLQNSPHQKPKEIANGILRDFGVEVNYTQVWRGLEDAREQLHGSPKESYNKLPWFCEKIVETNPGSFAKLAINEHKIFESLFVSFYASICGFQKGCRPILFLEATSLKSKYQEVLLTANAIDGNDGFFPVAFAVVDAENENRWHWFLEQLKSVISVSESITFVSDRDKNLKKSVLDVFENAHHGYSMYHLLESFKRNAKGPFHGEGRGFLPVHFLAAAQAVRPGGFKKSIEQIRLISSQSYDWVMQIEVQHWATSSFKGERYNYITQDVGEPYAKLMEDSRELPILQKLDTLIRMLTDLMDDARLDASMWSTKLTASREQMLQEENLKAHGLKVLISSDTLFEVREDLTHVVNTSTWTCTCLGWKETGLPCCHAHAVFNSTGKSAYDYCSEYFTVDRYRSAYSEPINPVPIDGKPMEAGKDDSLVDGKPMAEEKDDRTVEGNPSEMIEEDFIVDENIVENEYMGSTMEDVGDSAVNDQQIEIEVGEEKEGESTLEGEPVEKEGEKPEGQQLEKEAGEEKEGESTLDGEPLEKEEGEKPEDDLTAALGCATIKEKGEKKEADSPNVLVLPPIPSKAPVQEKEKVEWNETEGEGKRTVTCTKCKQAGHNKKGCKAYSVESV